MCLRRSEGDLAQLRELPYCSINPSAEGCKGAKPLDTSLLASASSPVMDWKVGAQAWGSIV